MNALTDALFTRERIILTASIVAAIGIPAWLLSANSDSGESYEVIPLATKLSIAPAQNPAEALAAPLFNASRQPPPENMEVTAEANTTENPEAAPPTPVGLITGRKSAGLALVRSSDGQTIMARSGDVVDGWTIIGIAAAGVTYRRDAEQRQVGLDYGNRKTDEPAPPASPPFPQTGQ